MISDEFLKSPRTVSFRAKREIFSMLITNIIKISPYGRNDKLWVSGLLGNRY